MGKRSKGKGKGGKGGKGSGDGTGLPPKSVEELIEQMENEGKGKGSGDGNGGKGSEDGTSAVEDLIQQRVAELVDISNNKATSMDQKTISEQIALEWKKIKIPILERVSRAIQPEGQSQKPLSSVSDFMSSYAKRFTGFATDLNAHLPHIYEVMERGLESNTASEMVKQLITDRIEDLKALQKKERDEGTRMMHIFCSIEWEKIMLNIASRVESKMVSVFTTKYIKRMMAIADEFGQYQPKIIALMEREKNLKSGEGKSYFPRSARVTDISSPIVECKERENKKKSGEGEEESLSEEHQGEDPTMLENFAKPSYKKQLEEPMLRIEDPTLYHMFEELQTVDPPAMTRYWIDEEVLQKLSGEGEEESLSEEPQGEDPTMLENFAKPSHKKQLEERMLRIEDPTLYHMFEELQTVGPPALLRYWIDEEVLQELGKAMLIGMTTGKASIPPKYSGPNGDESLVHHTASHISLLKIEEKRGVVVLTDSGIPEVRPSPAAGVHQSEPVKKTISTAPSTTMSSPAWDEDWISTRKGPPSLHSSSTTISSIQPIIANQPIKVASAHTQSPMISAVSSQQAAVSCPPVDLEWPPRSSSGVNHQSCFYNYSLLQKYN